MTWRAGVPGKGASVIAVTYPEGSARSPNACGSPSTSCTARGSSNGDPFYRVAWLFQFTDRRRMRRQAAPDTTSGPRSMSGATPR